MLQINTGKLFTREIERTNELRGVLYTNARLPWRRDVVTAAGTLRSTDSGLRGRAVVYELEERIEMGPTGPGVLVSHTIGPFLQDFSVVASFALNVVVAPDRGIVDRLVSGRPEFASYDAPSKFVRRFFDETVWVDEHDADELIRFVDELLGLERRSFLAAIRAMRTYVAGLHRLQDDLGLAYTLLVSAVESLAQNFDGYETSWTDVEERKRSAVDEALRRASPATKDRVRHAIASVEHPSLARRYRAYVLDRVDNSYFRTGDALLGGAVGRRELSEALRQAYAIRSHYVHNLKELPDELSHPFGHWESTTVEGRPALTFQGLSRLTRHAIRAFVRERPKVEREPYDYALEQSGVVSMRLAAECWIWQPLLHPREARQRFQGLLEQVAAIVSRSEGAKLTDIRAMLGDVEKLMPYAPKSARPALYALYALFTGIVSAEQRRPRADEFMRRFAELGNIPAPEILVARTCFGSTDDWALEVHARAYELYWRERWTPTGLHAPRLLEAAMALVLAERHRTTGDLEGARRLVADAADNYPGQPKLIQLVETFDGADSLSWRDLLLPRKVDDDGKNLGQGEQADGNP